MLCGVNCLFFIGVGCEKKYINKWIRVSKYYLVFVDFKY